MAAAAELLRARMSCSFFCHLEVRYLCSAPQNISYVLRFAGLVVLDSSEADPVAATAELLRGAALPPLLKAGIMDSQQMLKHYLLLHDAASGADFKQ